MYESGQGPPNRCGDLEVHISDIKLIRTDTTLDLSQKVEEDPCKSATQGRCLRDQVASYFDGPLPQKINLISCELIVHISDIKLIRTDTTLDLSQKAEKGMLKHKEVFDFYNQSFSCLLVF
ncbi:hypothetical protein PHAVU_002G059100 [Phaseolus vulgaris]|uniref:Uncharacterized protein n=1 Tax=Phaseolus vulgaris TaxID=3885 RepID=V7CIX3_PHAVU|nr:hypothetical protein PHAVU_002G059100g [Phaseolus vulgaris]ESW29303.1 hypothetical protein PHAVU_002G059100g [Phaseolus vulgaris]